MKPKNWIGASFVKIAVLKGDLHDDVFLTSGGLLFCANKGFCYLNLAGIINFEKNTK